MWFYIELVVGLFWAACFFQSVDRHYSETWSVLTFIFSLVVFAHLAFMYVPFSNVFPWIVANYVFGLKCFGIYLLIGLAYGVARFIGKMKFINKKLTEWCVRMSCERTAIPESSLNSFCNTYDIRTFPPTINDFKGSLFMWVCLWPFTIVQWVLSRLADWLTAVLKAVFTPIMTYLNTRLYGDVVMVPKQEKKRDSGAF